MSLIQKAFTTDNGINYVNISLMLISTIAAFLLPFQLFLFAYGVLGPLHYLTEISWLDKRNFFTSKKSDIAVYVILGCVLTIPLFIKNTKIGNYTTSLIITAFFYTLSLLFLKNNTAKIGFALLIFVISYGIGADKKPFPIMLFGIMLPTLIHVFLFTGFFILFGALKNKSRSGYLSFLVFVLCAISFFIIKPSYIALPADNYVQSSMNNFDIINRALMRLFGFEGIHSFQEMFKFNYSGLFTQPAAIIAARFIAFAYTYHYLNWFSKTSIIKWHEVSKVRMGLILFLWIGSVGVYVYDYNTGFKILFLLSMLHVFLEFPLNIVSIRGIGKELKGMLAK